MNNKKIQYSKFIPAVSGIFFIAVLSYCLLNSSIPFEIATVAMTTSGAVALTSVVWYMKNSQAEKVANIKTNVYRVISEERLKYNREMMKLRNEYGIDVDDSENDSFLDSEQQDILDSIDSVMDEATSSIEIQMPNL